MMICSPRMAAPNAADAFGLFGSDDMMQRTIENVAALWIAPWQAYWALAFEAMDAANYRAGPRL